MSDANSTSKTHRDATSSLLYCVYGSKDVFLAPPHTNSDFDLDFDTDERDPTRKSLKYDPFEELGQKRGKWKRTHLGAGDSLFIPKLWWCVTPRGVSLMP